MTKWKKRVLAVLAVFGVAVMGLFIGALVSWKSVRILLGTETPDGRQKPIPKIADAEPPPVTASEAGWAAWRGAAGDGRSTVTGIVKDWSKGLDQRWRVDFLCQGESSATWSAPVVEGNRLVVCGRDDERDLVFCLGAADGKLIWLASYAADGDASHGSGPRATPCIDGDRVYTFGRSGDLACWSLHDGTEHWRQSVRDAGGSEPRWGHSSSPFLAGNLVIVQAGGKARTVAYDKMTGELAWKSGTGDAGYATAVSLQLGERSAIGVFHGKGLAAIDPADGTEIWDAPWETAYAVNATTPVVVDGGVFVTSGYRTGCGLFKVSESGAELVWRSEAIASHHSDPYVIDGYVYGYSGQSTQNKGSFKCLDLSDGTKKWATKAMGWGTCVLVDGHLLCCDIEGNIFLMRPDPSAFTLVTKQRGALGNIKGPVWTTPVVADGRLYLRYKQRMVCYELSP